MHACLLPLSLFPLNNNRRAKISIINAAVLQHTRRQYPPFPWLISFLFFSFLLFDFSNVSKKKERRANESERKNAKMLSITYELSSTKLLHKAKGILSLKFSCMPADFSTTTIPAKKKKNSIKIDIRSFLTDLIIVITHAC